MEDHPIQLMNDIDRRTFLKYSGLGAAAALAAGCVPRDGRTRPNLLYIMSDDLGYADLSITGRSDYTTPVLDALAREGVMLSQFYCAAPVCTPTRVALNTGRYPARVRAGLFEPLTVTHDGLLPTPKTLARLIKDEGYETGLIGKWHLGIAPEFHPVRHGYDEFYGFLGAAADYSSHIDTETKEPEFLDGDTPVKVDGYLTDLFTERAVRFIKKQRTGPFFLNLEYNAPHWPWQAPGDSARPDSLRNGRGGTAATYAAMVRRLDEGIGQVLAALKESGRDRDTLVIFTSDNGGERFSQMGPFSHGKMSLYEGGLRVPAFARWPGVIPANSKTDQVSITMDWTATLLARAGATPEPSAPLDGIDLMPALIGKASPVQRDLYWRTFQRARFKAMRSGDWKYLESKDGKFLFDLRGDAGEKADLKSQKADVLAQLEAKYAAWERSVLPPIPLVPNS